MKFYYPYWFEFDYVQFIHVSIRESVSFAKDFRDKFYWNVHTEFVLGLRAFTKKDIAADDDGDNDDSTCRNYLSFCFIGYRSIIFYNTQSNGDLRRSEITESTRKYQTSSALHYNVYQGAELVINDLSRNLPYIVGLLSCLSTLHDIHMSDKEPLRRSGGEEWVGVGVNKEGY